MSKSLDYLQLNAADAVKFLACQTHIGSPNVDFQMAQYVYKRRTDGVHIIDLRKTWEKVILAARAIAAIENPADVCVISARTYGQRAVLKFAHHTGASAVAGRFTPGTFTNQIQKAFREPRLLVVTDPRTDHQAVTEASYVNIPVIALCNTDSPLKLVDIAIPCNNKGAKSIGLMWWLLSREVLIMQGRVSRELCAGLPKFILEGNEVMADLYFYRDTEETEKEEQAAPAAADRFGGNVTEDWGQELGAATQAAVVPSSEEWQTTTVAAGALGGGVQPQTMDWAAEVQAAGQYQAAAATAAPQAGGGQEWGGGAADSWK